MVDRSKNISGVLDFFLPFVYYYYVMHVLWIFYRHYMKHCSFFCDQCVLKTRNRLSKPCNGFIFIKTFESFALLILAILCL